MKINCELPNQMLSMNIDLNEYDFVLLHLFQSDPIYKEYYKGLRSTHRSRLMIFDNSAYEFFVRGIELDIEAFKKAILELQPDLFLLPDVLMDRNKTIEKTQQFLDVWDENDASRPMAVLQGNSPEELIECANIYKGLNITHIAIPFHNSFLKEYSKNYNSVYNNHLRNDWRLRLGKIDVDDEYALGRILFIYNYRDVLSQFKHVHLLGSHRPFEKFYEQDFDFIKTMDTGYPVKCGIVGYELGKEPQKPDVIIDDFLNKDISIHTQKLISNNIGIFKQY